MQNDKQLYISCNRLKLKLLSLHHESASEIQNMRRWSNNEHLDFTLQIAWADNGQGNAGQTEPRHIAIKHIVV